MILMIVIIMIMTMSAVRSVVRMAVSAGMVTTSVLAPPVATALRCRIVVEEDALQPWLAYR